MKKLNIILFFENNLLCIEPLFCFNIIHKINNKQKLNKLSTII